MHSTKAQSVSTKSSDTTHKLIIKQFIRNSGMEAVLSLSGEFGFCERRSFFAALKQCLVSGNCKKIDLDLSHLKKIDTAALGMILIAIDQVGPNCKFSISNSNPDIGQLLNIAKLDRHCEVIQSWA